MGDRSVTARKYLPLLMWSIFKTLASQAGLIAHLPLPHPPLAFYILGITLKS